MTNKVYYKRISAPALEPLTLAEIKLLLRIDATEHDAYLLMLIEAARETTEEYANIALITQTWQASCYNFEETLQLAKYPVQAVTSVKAVDCEGDELALTSDQYCFDQTDSSITLHSCPTGFDHIEVEFTAGFGADSTVVPAAIKQAIIAHIQLMFENRVNCIGLPDSSKAVYQTYRKVRL